jgi:hypothetical protein
VIVTSGPTLNEVYHFLNNCLKQGKMFHVSDFQPEVRPARIKSNVAKDHWKIQFCIFNYEKIPKIESVGREVLLIATE